MNRAELLDRIFDPVINALWYVLCPHKKLHEATTNNRTAELHTAKGVKVLRRCATCGRLLWVKAQSQ